MRPSTQRMHRIATLRHCTASNRVVKDDKSGQTDIFVVYFGLGVGYALIQGTHLACRGHAATMANGILDRASRISLLALGGWLLFCCVTVGTTAAALHRFSGPDQIQAGNWRRVAECADFLIVAASYVATRLLLANVLLRRRLSEQASRDPLTGILNRRYFTDVLPGKLRPAKEDGCTAALLLIDIDGFKYVNDARGPPDWRRALARSRPAFDQLRRPERLCHAPGWR